MALSLCVHVDGHAAFVAGKISQCLSEQAGEGVTNTRCSLQMSTEELNAQRRGLLASMSQHGPALLDMHLRTASYYLQKLKDISEAAEQTAARDAVSASLDATAAAVAWLPLGVLRKSALVDACTALVQADAFRGAVVEVLMHASSRNSKQAGQEAEDYAVLYSHFASLLVTACQSAVPDEHTADHFETDEAAAAAAKRSAEVAAAFVLNGHLAKVAGAESQLQVCPNHVCTSRAHECHAYLQLAVHLPQSHHIWTQLG